MNMKKLSKVKINGIELFEDFCKKKGVEHSNKIKLSFYAMLNLENSSYYRFDDLTDEAKEAQDLIKTYPKDFSSSFVFIKDGDKVKLMESSFIMDDYFDYYIREDDDKKVLVERVFLLEFDSNNYTFKYKDIDKIYFKNGYIYTDMYNTDITYIDADAIDFILKQFGIYNESVSANLSMLSENGYLDINATLDIQPSLLRSNFNLDKNWLKYRNIISILDYKELINVNDFLLSNNLNIIDLKQLNTIFNNVIDNDDKHVLISSYKFINEKDDKYISRFLSKNNIGNLIYLLKTLSKLEVKDKLSVLNAIEGINGGIYLEMLDKDMIEYFKAANDIDDVAVLNLLNFLNEHRFYEEVSDSMKNISISLLDKNLYLSLSLIKKVVLSDEELLLISQVASNKEYDKKFLINNFKSFFVTFLEDFKDVVMSEYGYMEIDFVSSLFKALNIREELELDFYNVVLSDIFFFTNNILGSSSFNYSDRYDEFNEVSKKVKRQALLKSKGNSLGFLSLDTRDFSKINNINDLVEAINETIFIYTLNEKASIFLKPSDEEDTSYIQNELLYEKILNSRVINRTEVEEDKNTIINNALLKLKNHRHKYLVSKGRLWELDKTEYLLDTSCYLYKDDLELIFIKDKSGYILEIKDEYGNIFKY